MKNAYTIFWRYGTTDVIFGDCFENAFYENDFKFGDRCAISFHLEGIDHSYYWNAGEREWVQKDTVHITAQECEKWSVDRIMRRFDTCQVFDVEIKNKDVISLSLRSGSYGDFGDLVFFSVYYGCLDSELTTEKGKPSYHVEREKLFKLNDLDLAVMYLLQSVTENGAGKKTCIGNSTMEEIAKSIYK